MGKSSFVVGSLLAGLLLFFPTDSFAANEPSVQKSKDQSIHSMQNNGLVEKEKKIQLKREDKSSHQGKRISEKSRKSTEKAVRKHNQQENKKMNQKPKRKEAAKDRGSTPSKGSEAMVHVVKGSKQTKVGQEKKPALLKERKIKTRSMKQNQRSDSPFSIPSDLPPYPSAVLPLVQLPVAGKNNSGNGGGGQDVLPFKDKAWVDSHGLPEQLALYQSLISKADGLVSQWMNAPPTKPPRIASSLFM